MTKGEDRDPLAALTKGNPVAAAYARALTTGRPPDRKVFVAMAILEMEALAASHDHESAHARADEILLAIAAVCLRDQRAMRLAEAYGRIERWFA